MNALWFYIIFVVIAMKMSNSAQKLRIGDAIFVDCMTLGMFLSDQVIVVIQIKKRTL